MKFPPDRESWCDIDRNRSPSHLLILVTSKMTSDLYQNLLCFGSKKPQSGTNFSSFPEMRLFFSNNVRKNDLISRKEDDFIDRDFMNYDLQAVIKTAKTIAPPIHFSKTEVCRLRKEVEKARWKLRASNRSSPKPRLLYLLRHANLGYKHRRKFVN